jgi:capsular exopolysaccharide synthesis family protein
VVVKLKGDLATVEAQHRELGQTFRPQYPRMRRLEQNISELRSQIQSEVRRVAKALDADHRAALQNERQIEKSMEELRARAMRIGDHMVQYNILRRDVDASRELYTSLLTRLRETQVSGDLLSSPISIVDRAEVPLMPSRPRKSLVLVLGGIVGLLAGLGAAYAREFLDPRFRSVEDVDRLLGVPRLGLVPQRHRREGRRLLQPTRRPPFALVAHHATYSLSAEAFRDLRTSFLYAGGERPVRTVMVTSPDAGDGKTALATNLAIALAQLGTSDVLLIDANLRHPELHKLLDVPRGPGLSAFLTGRAELPAVLRATDIDNLYVIPAGRMPDNPAELLASPRLRQALEVLSEQFAHIVVDTPPLSGISDALNLAPRLDGVVLVLRQGRSERTLAQEAVQRLGVVRANLLGVVVNGADARTSRQRYRRWNYYAASRERDDDPGDE